MRLRLGHLRHVRNEKAVNPRREGLPIHHWISIEDELRDDLLSPGRAAFAPGGDDNVIITILNVVPAARVEHNVPQLA